MKPGGYGQGLKNGARTLRGLVAALGTVLKNYPIRRRLKRVGRSLQTSRRSMVRRSMVVYFRRGVLARRRELPDEAELELSVPGQGASLRVDCGGACTIAAICEQRPYGLALSSLKE